MAEILAGIGVTASVAQLLSYVIKTSQVVTVFCHDFEDAPSELHRIREKMLLLHNILESFEHYLIDVDDVVLLPLDLRLLLQGALQTLEEVVAEMQRKFCVNEFWTLTKRFKFAFVDCNTMTKLLVRLRDAESTLTCLVQLLTLYISLPTLDARANLR